MIQAKQQEEQMKMQFQASENEKDRQKDIIEAQIRSAGYGSMADINQNEQSDYLDALDRIEKTDQYQQQMSLQRDKESNRMVENREKINLEQQKLQTQKDIAQTQLKIAQENKNKYDVSKKNEKKDEKKKK